MQMTEEAYLAHYGILRRSGRYPWGSGKTQSSRNKKFLDMVDELRQQGMKDVDIARGFGITTTQLRAASAIAKNEQKQARISQAQALKDKGMSNVAIGQKMGLNESSVRALLAPGEKDKADVLQTTANMLKNHVDEKKFVDIGKGTEQHVGVSTTVMNNAVAVLKEQGYEVHSVPVPQLGTGQNTTVKVLTTPGTTWGDTMRNRDSIKQITSFSDDGGRTFFGLQPPLSINSDRVKVRYKEDGGAEADGVIFVRPGVEDISLGKASYAQVRVKVDDSHYLKGMAMYKDDLPKGTDLVFNTNKSNTGNKLDAMKKLSDDPDNPFGAVVGQIVERQSDGKKFVTGFKNMEILDGTEKVTSAMNIVNEEGDWGKWSKSLSSQMLSKQSPSLAKAQLGMTYEERVAEFDRISKLTNPAVRKKLLEDFADQADSAAVHLKAKALPNQASHVILPIDSMSPTQVYAPNYKDGERVALVRFPHGGTFEIPELTVNNNHPEAKALLGQAKDAIGIHHSVAERLSGADFDGDTVLVIPNGSGKVKSSPALEGLKGFDPRHSYPGYDGMKVMTPRQKGIEMGDVSNLITDMTIKGASTDELARAVRHSMVVIDAEKHKLNWKLSAERNGIAQLKEKYQGGARKGASTLISKAGSETRVPDRKARPASQGGPVDKATGKKVFVETGLTRFTKDGAVVPKMIKVKRLEETSDANTLSSGTRIESIYADHSNKLKTLANRARKDAVNTPNASYSPSAKKVYKNEVSSLDAKLNLALRNAPLERQAQLLANSVVKQKQKDNPDMDKTTLKKVKAQALNEARNRTGARKQRIEVTEKEWEAIQAGAISNNKLTGILANADMDIIKDHATPKKQVLMTSAKTRRAQQMLDSGYTRAEVAAALGVSLTTLDTATGSTG